MHIQSFTQSERCFYGLVRLNEQDEVILELAKSHSELLSTINTIGHALNELVDKHNTMVKALNYQLDKLEERIKIQEDFGHNLITESESAARAFKISKAAYQIQKDGV